MNACTDIPDWIERAMNKSTGETKKFVGEELWTKLEKFYSFYDKEDLSWHVQEEVEGNLLEALH